MKPSDFGRDAVCICVVATILAGCGGAQSTIGAPRAMPQNWAQRERGGPWMDSRAKHWTLLYVSNVNGTVNVYRYWQQNLVGVLTGFGRPEGECVDRAGNVYVTDFALRKIFEYGHGGGERIRTINDRPFEPDGCAVDPTTGNLAVANYENGTGGDGNIAVYARAKRRPIFYNAKHLRGYESCAYDSEGNLLTTDGADGDSGLGSGFAWLPKGGTKLLTIELHGGSSWGGGFDGVQGIAWDGEYWVLNTMSYAGDLIYRVVIKHRRGGSVGTTYVSGQYGALGQLAIYNNHSQGQGTQIVGANAFGFYQDVYYWDYPAGGRPIMEITQGLDRPFGVAISLKQKR